MPESALPVSCPLRIEYSGAIYHVMSRGDRREPIFKEDHDRQRFLATLDEAAAKWAAATL